MAAGQTGSGNPRHTHLVHRHQLHAGVAAAAAALLNDGVDKLSTMARAAGVQVLPYG
jgi:hypothetical protein